MGQKIHPRGIRLGYIQDWQSKWFSVHKMPEVTRASLALHLRTDAKTFREQYPIPDAQRAHLLQTFAAGRQGEVDPKSATTHGATGGPVQLSATRSLPAGAIDIRAFTGRNSVEKAMSYLASKDANFAKQDLGEQVRAAGSFLRANQVVAL